MGRTPGTTRQAFGVAAPRIASLAEDELLQGVVRYFQERTGVQVTFQDPATYAPTAASRTLEFCSILAADGRCGLVAGGQAMPPDPDLPYFRTCAGGIGHLLIPLVHRGPTGAAREIGRLVSGPIATRPSVFEELMPTGGPGHAHPDTMMAAARAIPMVDRAEIQQFCNLVTIILARVASERAHRARSLAVAEAFEEVGMHGSREVIRELLAGLVRDFSDADAVILSTRSVDDGPIEHQAAFIDDLGAEERALLMEFTTQVVEWISQTGYPISFPDLGGSAWRRHVLDGHDLEGSLVAVPVKMPGDWRGWWTAYYRRPMAQMEDQLHRLSVLAAHSAQTLTFVSQLEASEEAAMTDSLTQLGNRRFLHEQLQRELARSARGRYPISMIIIDIDDFKGINDTYGHRAGDNAIRLVADALRQPLRRSNTICRYGGDEFCVVLPECTTEEALGVAHRLREEVSGVGVEVAPGQTVHLRVSAGIATHDPSEPTSRDLFEMADQALIIAKREGKDRVLVSADTIDHPGMSAPERPRLSAGPYGPGPLVECVPNVSEGRRAAVITALGDAVTRTPGCCLLDVHSDVDHNRSVFTFTGTPDAVRAGVMNLAEAAIEMIDMRRHVGVHPRLGALDVVPFIPLAGIDMHGCVSLARETAAALAAAHDLPVFLYAEAADPGRPDTLAAIRRGGFEGLAAPGRAPLDRDFGPAVAHPTAGACAVGARDPLLAFNLVLDTRELSAARRIAAVIRESGNGLSGVQAIGLYLPSRDHAQVSMNLLDYQTTPLDALVEAVRRAAVTVGAQVVEAELVGLAPRDSLRAGLGLALPGMPDLTRSIEVRHQACAG